MLVGEAETASHREQGTLVSSEQSGVMEDDTAGDASSPVVDLTKIEVLSETGMFDDLDQATLKSFADCFRFDTALAGEILMKQGDLPDDAFVVAAGRLQVSTVDERGEELVVGEIGPGEMVGEMALLTRASRTATVTAMRDTRLLRISQDDFSRLMASAPSLLLDVTRAIVTRFERYMHQRHPSPRVRVIGVMPGGTLPTHRDFATRFAEAVGAGARVALVPERRMMSDLGSEPSEWEITAYLHRIEADHDLTLLVADADDSAWTRRCLRQADLNFLVGHSSDSTLVPHGELPFEPGEQAVRPPLHLVLMHRDTKPSGTSSLLRSFEAIDRHHHVHVDDKAHLERLGRMLRGESVGLVLSGGGARGFAHVGVVRALQEAGIPVDHVGGTSMGAAVASLLAMGHGWEEILADLRTVTVERGPLVDFTFPVVALGRGERLTSGLRAVVGDRHIEDLWIDYFGVSTDLTAAEPRLHTTGPLWRAIRASVAIPGILPPVRSEDDHVLVDGGVINNLPTDVMVDRFHPSSVIAVDLRPSARLPVDDLGEDGVQSGWKTARRRLVPWRPRAEVPRILDILVHASTVDTTSDNTAFADLVFRPPVEEHGMLDFRGWEQIFTNGYRDAIETLETLQAPVPATIGR